MCEIAVVCMCVGVCVCVTLQEGISPVERVFSRAVFTMDYRDSDLFNLLEDTIRQQVTHTHTHAHTHTHTHTHRLPWV